MDKGAEVPQRVRGSGHLFRPRWKRRGWTAYKTSVVWWWKAPSGQRLSTGCVRKRDAERWAQERLAEAGRGGLVGAVQKPPRYEDCERMLLDRLEADQRKSIPVIECRLAYLRGGFAGWLASDITPDMVTRYALARVKAGAAVATVNSSLGWLRRMLGLAYEAGRLPRMPVVHRLRGARRRTGTVDPHLFAQIVSRMPAQHQAPVRVLWLTGWRLREVTELRWSEVDMQACVLRLPASRSKTNRARELSFKGSELEGILNAQLRTLSPWVFPGRGGRAIHRTTLEKAWRAACQAQGVAGQPILHDLRRSMATTLAAAGVPLATAQDVLGHQDLRSALGYVVTSGEVQRQALLAVEAARAAVPQKVVQMEKRNG